VGFELLRQAMKSIGVGDLAEYKIGVRSLDQSLTGGFNSRVDSLDGLLRIREVVSDDYVAVYSQHF